MKVMENNMLQLGKKIFPTNPEGPSKRKRARSEAKDHPKRVTFKSQILSTTCMNKFYIKDDNLNLRMQRSMIPWNKPPKITRKISKTTPQVVRKYI